MYETKKLCEKVFAVSRIRTSTSGVKLTPHASHYTTPV